MTKPIAGNGSVQTAIEAGSRPTIISTVPAAPGRSKKTSTLTSIKLKILQPEKSARVMRSHLLNKSVAERSSTQDDVSPIPEGRDRQRGMPILPQ